MIRSREIAPLGRRLDLEATVPGSKSITNRALAIASLAHGTSEIVGALHANDTTAMIESLQKLGALIERGPRSDSVTGVEGHWNDGPIELDVRQAATVARFLLPSLLLGRGVYRLDGDDQIKRRPMGPLVEAVNGMGLQVDGSGKNADQLPLTVTASFLPPEKLRAPITGDVSSQFLSGLLLAGPCLPKGLEIDLTGRLVSKPYIDMTLAVMQRFGAEPVVDGGHFIVPPTGYTATTYVVEPDASAASYFFGAAAICGGRVRVRGLTEHPLQGDIEFVRVLEKMGVKVLYGADFVEVQSNGVLHGIEAGIDMANFSDTAQTLAVVAAFADSPTRVHGIGFIKAKETDRVNHVVEQLNRCGVTAMAEEDGFIVYPSNPHGALIKTYGDHRMAMSFSLIGLRTPGIVIDDERCVDKTFPKYWEAFEQLYTIS